MKVIAMKHDGVSARDHDNRVTELITHNNELLEKYRAEKALRKENELRADGLLLATLAMASMSGIVAKELEKVTAELVETLAGVAHVPTKDGDHDDEMLEHEMRDRLATKDAEIARLRAGRDELLSHWQVKHTHDLVTNIRTENDGLRAALASLRAERDLLRTKLYRGYAAAEERDTLRAELECEINSSAEIAEEASSKGRQDAKTISQLKEALQEIVLWFSGGGNGFNSVPWLTKARAALACSPWEVHVPSHGPFPGAPFSPRKFGG